MHFQQYWLYRSSGFGCCMIHVDLLPWWHICMLHTFFFLHPIWFTPDPSSSLVCDVFHCRGFRMHHPCNRVAGSADFLRDWLSSEVWLGIPVWCLRMKVKSTIPQATATANSKEPMAYWSSNPRRLHMLRRACRKGGEFAFFVAFFPSSFCSFFIVFS